MFELPRFKPLTKEEKEKIHLQIEDRNPQQYIFIGHIFFAYTLEPEMYTKTWTKEEKTYIKNGKYHEEDDIEVLYQLFSVLLKKI